MNLAQQVMGWFSPKPETRPEPPVIRGELAYMLNHCRFWKRNGKRLLLGFGTPFFVKGHIDVATVRKRLHQLDFRDEARDPAVVAHVARFLARRPTEEQIEGKPKRSWVHGWRK